LKVSLSLQEDMETWSIVYRQQIRSYTPDGLCK
jgi:hypothetical protein